MKVRAELSLLTLALQLVACAEPARDVDSVSVVVSVTSSEVAPQPPIADRPSAVAVATASASTGPDPDEVMKQRLLRALEEARVDAKKPKPPPPRGSSPPCAASDPLCD